MTVSDMLLLERWQKGDDTAFAGLFIQHYPAVLRLLTRMLGSADEADDVAQEVFIRLHRRPLAPGREHNLHAWLVRVATRLGYNALRERARRQRRQEAWELERTTSIPGPESEAERAETQAEVRLTLAQMSLRQAQILFLRHQGYSYEEMAGIVGVKESSVGTLLARAERAFEQTYRGLHQPRVEASHR